MPKSIQPNKIMILDCTLRDGGYYNNWDFPKDLVLTYLESISAAKVDAIEVGFRSFPKKNKFLGPFGFSTDEFLSLLPIPENIITSVMVNAKEVLAYSEGVEAAVNKLFKESSLSPVNMVRVACHFHELKAAGAIARFIKEKGYVVSFQMMQAGGKSREELIRASRTVVGNQAVDIIYFADSLGNMVTDDISSIVEAIRMNWNGPIGIHTHDNTNHAIDNSLAAIDAGVTWVDGTVLGIGRGAGNARLEYLLIEFQKRGIGNYYPDAIYPLVIQEFERLKKQYGWGPNLLYYLSGVYGIHPTYIQELLSDERYEAYHIINAIEYLGKSGESTFKNDILYQAILGSKESTEGTWSPEGWAKGHDMIIVAPGPGAQRHLEEICRFIDKTNPVVICLNVNDLFPHEKITAYAACHPTRLHLDSNKLRSLSKPLIVPFAQIPEGFRKLLDNATIFDYGMKVEENVFSIHDKYCTIPALLVAAYTFAIGVASGAKRLLLAGFDGFGIADNRHREMVNMINCYLESQFSVPLVAITPTTYPVMQESIYSPGL